MLLSLRIQNFALIDDLDLEFGLGLNVFTGETGAGKSIILDALDAALGGKVSHRVIRTGTNRAILEATFHVSSTLGEWLGQQEIELVDENIIVCSREITNYGNNIRSRSRLNGILVNRALMDQLKTRLVEFTAQGQTIQLGDENIQQDWLDLYGGEDLIKHRQKITLAYQNCQQIATTLTHRRQSEQHRLQRLDLLEYQVRELSQANLTDPQELEQLEQERQRLNHGVELQQKSYQLYQELYQNDGGVAVADLLSHAESVLTHMIMYDPTLENILEMVTDALAQVTEAGRQINNYGEQLEADPQRLEEVEERIRQLKQISRKYGILSEAIHYYETIQTELNELKEGGESLEILEQTYQNSQQELQELCQEMTHLRKTTAWQLETRLIEELKPLAMEKVQFNVLFKPIIPQNKGADKIIFCFSPNPGEPLQPLSLTASGGEMSRFLLALKACFSEVDGSPTLVFDEIDVGVSGKVAHAIAQKLYQLSQRHQVLCVTHQPLVASMADHHYRVIKQVIENPEISENLERTVVRVHLLEHQQRPEELAQLASGQSAHEALIFAESLLTQAHILRHPQPTPTPLPKKRRSQSP